MASARTVSWPTVAVLLVGLVVIGATSIVGLLTHVEHEPLIAVLGAEATLFASVLAFMRAILPPLVALVVASVVATSACGASAIGTQARLAHSLALVTQTAGGQVDDARARALDDVEHRTADLGTEARLAALDAEAAHWAPAGAALDALRETLRTWTSAIALALAADGDTSLLPPLAEVLARVLLLYDRIAALARELGADIPAIPAEVRAVVVGVAGGG